MISARQVRPRYIIACLFISITALAAACGSDDAADSTPETATLDVLTTIYPLTYFTERIGGDRVDVTSIIKPGVEAHDFEPTPGDIRAIGAADVLIYNHPAFETWIEDAINTAGNADLVAVKAADLPDDVELSHGHGHEDEDELADSVLHVIEEVESGEITAEEGIEEIEALIGGHDEEEHSEGETEIHLEDEIIHVIEEVEVGDIAAEAGIEEIEELVGGHEHEEATEADGHDHEDGDIDPHVWLNPIEAVEQVRAIEAALAQADADGAAMFKTNADALVAELEKVDEQFAEGLASCQFNEMVVSHLAYGHLAEQYDLHQLGLSGLSPDFDSGPQQITSIIDEMRELGIMHILQEPISDDRLAETVANETGATVLPLHPLESLTNEEVDAGETYFTVMAKNLESLRTALVCE